MHATHSACKIVSDDIAPGHVHIPSMQGCSIPPFFAIETVATLGEAKGATDSMSLPSSLPEPEVYVIVNGKPTKRGVLWQNLVNVDSVKHALATLKQINWLYTDVADDCVDEAVQKVLEVSNNATTAVSEKASETDIAAFQQYTIRNLDTKLVCGSDLEQYKMLSPRSPSMTA